MEGRITFEKTPVKPHVTAPEDRVPVFQKLMYGAGSGSYQLAGEGVKGLAYSIYNITLGLSPTLVGLVLMISRLFDAFTDPLMGKLSDDTRTRWGRRRPFIFVGAFLTAFAFVLLWLVPAEWSSSAIFVYYLVAMLFFYLCATIQSVPYHTLGLELTPDYHERTVVSAYKMFFSFTFTIFTPWAFRLAQAETFDNVMEGIRFLSWGFAAAIVLGGILPAIFCQERFYKIASHQQKVPFWKGLKWACQNRPFVILTGIVLVTGVGGNMVNSLGPYIIYYHMLGGDLKAGATLAAMGANVFSICAIVSIWLLTIMSRRYGKIRTLRFLILLGIVGAFSKFFLYNKEYPYLLFVSQAMVAPLAAGFWTLTTSMKADVCDDDELQHGMRREGVFGSVGAWVTKVSIATTFLISGIILEATGFDVALKGNQAPETLLWMRLFFCIVPIIAGLIALLLLHRYPLDEQRMTEIREELEARRAAV